MEKVTAAKLFLLTRSRKDFGLTILRILDELDKLDITKVLKFYKEIIAEELKIVEIITATKLDNNQRKSIEKKLQVHVEGKLVFVYEIDKRILGGLLIRIDDSILDKTLLRKVNNINIQ